jgi:hypothetical protein
MNIQNATIGTEVVRSKGDYVVGNVGNIIAIDAEKNRAQVSWGTWVSFTAIEPTSIPYTITEGSYNKKTGKHSWPKYNRL